VRAAAAKKSRSAHALLGLVFDIPTVSRSQWPRERRAAVGCLAHAHDDFLLPGKTPAAPKATNRQHTMNTTTPATTDCTLIPRASVQNDPAAG
jgi:hypothetical protein